MNKTKLWYIGIFFVWLVYIFFYFSVTSTKTLIRYDITQSQLQLIRATIAVPLLFIWMILMFGYRSVSRYAQTLKASWESEVYQNLSRGLGTLLFGLVYSTFINQVYYHFVGNPEVQLQVKIFQNYSNTLISLLAMYFLFKAGHTIELSSRDTLYKRAAGLIMLASSIFLWFYFSNPFRVASPQGPDFTTYGLSDWITLPTLVLPLIVSWTLGIVAFLNFRQFAQEVRGHIFRKFFSPLSTGLLLVVAGSVFSNILGHMGTYFLEHGIANILVIVYCFLLLITVGYFLIAQGARKLRLLEEVV